MIHPNHETLPRRTSADTEGEVQRVLAKLEAAGTDLTISRILANNPSIFRPYILVSSALMTKGALPADVREAIILVLAQANAFDYEWAEHVPLAKGVGVTDEQITAIISGSVAEPLFTAEQCFGVEVASKLFAGRGVSDVDWAECVRRWGEVGALDLVCAVGWWGGFVRYVIEGLGLVMPDRARDGG